MLVKKIEKGEKTVYSVCGIKFVRRHLEKIMSVYNNNRFYNCIVKEMLPYSVRRGILEDRFFKKTGYFPNLDNPQTFNEKLTWLKLYYHENSQVECVDKGKFKDYVTRVIGKKYVIPTIGIYDRVEDINFDELPNKFVIKSTCGWGGDQVIIVKDKRKRDFDKLKAMANSWLVPWNNYFYQSFEWDYENIKPRLIVEEFLEDINGDVPDYKFFCYAGDPKVVLVIEDRFKRGTIKKTFLDKDWNVLPICRPNSKVNKKITKPENYDEMVKIACKLSKPFPFVRVDFYNVRNKIYVGELTFYPGGGVEPFASRRWDYQLGEMMDLPNRKEM